MESRTGDGQPHGPDVPCSDPIEIEVIDVGGIGMGILFFLCLAAVVVWFIRAGRADQRDINHMMERDVERRYYGDGHNDGQP